MKEAFDLDPLRRNYIVEVSLPTEQSGPIVHQTVVTTESEEELLETTVRFASGMEEDAAATVNIYELVHRDDLVRVVEHRMSLLDILRAGERTETELREAAMAAFDASG